MLKTILSILLVFAFSACTSKKPSKKTEDPLSEVLNNPTKFKRMEFQSRYWVYEDYLVHFISNINEEKRNLSPIIYVHGLGGSLEDFSELIQILHHSKSFRPVYALDLPGFGKSYSRNSEISIRKYSHMLGEFIQNLSTSKINLVCHSMGGQVCIDFALANPNQVQLLTLISPAGVYQKSNYVNQTLNHYIGISVGQVEHPNANSIGDLSWLNQRFAQKMLTNNPTVLMAIESYRDNFRNRINQLKTKTLILWGHNDTVFSFENGLYLKENIVNSTLYIIEGADHFPLKSHAVFISKLILKYL